MALADKFAFGAVVAVVGGVIAAVGGIVKSIVADAQETRRRKASLPMFVDGITEDEFSAMVRRATATVPRIDAVGIDGMVVSMTVRSNTGLTKWNAQVDFNDYGHLTGMYWLDSQNDQSVIPGAVAEALATDIRHAIDAATQGAPPATNEPLTPSPQP